MFPVVTVSGSAFERGRQYGEQARDRVRRSITDYAATFEHFAGWDWSRATREAERFVPAIGDFRPALVEELGLTREDVVTLAKNSFAGSFLPEAEKARRVAEVEAYAAAH